MLLLVLASIYCFVQRFAAMQFPIEDFSAGVLGLAAKRNVDIGLLTKAYYGYLLILCPLFVWICHQFIDFSFLQRKLSFLSARQLGYSGRFFLFMLCLMASNCSMGLFMFLFIALGMVFWTAKHHKQRRIVPEIYASWLALSMSAVIPLALLHGSMVSSSSTAVELLWGTAAAGILGAGLLGVYRTTDAELWLKKMRYISLPLVLLPVFFVFFLEIIYTLNTYQIFTHSIMLLIVCSAAVLLCFWRGRSAGVLSSRTYYICAAWGSVAMSAIRLQNQENKLGLFEGANHGLAVFNAWSGYGLPMLQNFDAHMLSNSLWGILYAALNHDAAGAVLVPYIYIVDNLLISMGLFYVLKNFLGARDAYLFLLFCPLVRVFYWWTFLAGFIVLAVFICWLREKTWSADAKFWAMLVFACLYQLDVGMAFGVSAFLAALFWLVQQKAYAHLRRFLSIGVLSGLIFAGCVGILCKTQGILPAGFLQNFLTAALSNMNWFYGSLGPERAVYMIYLILPLLITFLLGGCIPRVLRGSRNPRLWAVVFLYIASILNASRAFVRHSLVENSPIAYALPLILLGSLGVLYWPRARSLVFTVFVLGLWALTGLPLNAASYDSLPPKTAVWSEAKQRVDAAVYSLSLNNTSSMHLKPDDQKLADEVKGFMEGKLQAGETWLDFTNQSLLYAILDQKSPVYVNQSPGMVNGRKGQKEFLREIQSANAPFVLMPYVPGADPYALFSSLDEIQNTDRYYLITEYICRNYEPLCQAGSIAVWCRKTDAEEWRKQTDVQNRHLLKDYAYNGDAYYRHDLGDIPFLWQNYSGKPQLGPKQELLLKNPEEKLYAINMENLDMSLPWDMIVSLQSETNGEAQLVMKNRTGRQITYRFKVHAGSLSYRLRCSSDILWYQQDLEQIQVQTAAQIKEICLTPADE